MLKWGELIIRISMHSGGANTYSVFLFVYHKATGTYIPITHIGEESRAEERRIEPDITHRENASKEASNSIEHRKEPKINPYIIPDNDMEVKMQLRRHRHPIHLFGENKSARRERLKKLMEKKPEPVPLPKSKEPKPVKEEPKLFYTIGSDELKAARTQIAYYSIPKACLRCILLTSIDLVK
jgi:hypothetical protein